MTRRDETKENMLTSSRFGLIMLTTSVAFSLEAAASGLTWLNCSQTEVQSFSVAASEGTVSDTARGLAPI